MKRLTQFLVPLFLKFGGIGLLALGVFDSSFLFAPLGNDLLVVALSARYHNVLRALYYAAMSTAGSVLGTLLVDLVFREAGELGLEHHLSRARIDSLKRRIAKRAGWGLTVASIAPPPFPFTAFIMAASALQYPRRRLLVVVGAARMVRFAALGLLAVAFGPQILAWSENPIVQGGLIGLMVLCAVGSVISAARWIRRSRAAKAHANRLGSAPGRPERG